jgi:Response regulator containing CheY-like receiver, AAA-type ATPase, and DNA-binding domains
MTWNVLLLDDDETVLSILSATLSGAGYHCYETNSPDQALAAVAKHDSISVVVSDIYMPTMTGFEFVDRLGALQLNRPCPRVLLLTAQPTLQCVVDALRLGVCDFLTKPVKSSDLLNGVKRAMERAMQDRNDYSSPIAKVERLIQQSRDLTEHLRSLTLAKEMSAPSVPVMQEAEKSARNSADTAVLDTIDTLRQLKNRYAHLKLDDLSWDLLLELARADRRRQRLSVSGLMISVANVSPTTLLRRINDLTERGYVTRIPDPNDARRDFVALTPKANELISEFIDQVFAYIGSNDSRRAAK